MDAIEIEAEQAAKLRDREGLTTREISARIGIPQSTVVRRLKLHDTGPQKAIKAKIRKNLLPIVLLAFSVLVMIAAAGAFIFLRTARPVVVVPAVACVRSAASGTVTGLRATSSGSCPRGWAELVLTPQR